VFHSSEIKTQIVSSNLQTHSMFQKMSAKLVEVAGLLEEVAMNNGSRLS
jgi:hypothetical protein